MNADQRMRWHGWHITKLHIQHIWLWWVVLCCAVLCWETEYASIIIFGCYRISIQRFDAMLWLSWLFSWIHASLFISQCHDGIVCVCDIYSTGDRFHFPQMPLMNVYVEILINGFSNTPHARIIITIKGYSYTIMSHASSDFRADFALSSEQRSFEMNNS